MSTIARKSAETFIFRLVTQVFAVAIGILIARALGPANKGIYTYVTTVGGLILTFVMGQSAAVSYEYARRKRAVLPVVATSLRIFWATIVPISIVIAAAALTFTGQLPLVALAAALPFMALSVMLVGFFNADSNVRVLNMQQVFPSILLGVVLLPLLLWLHLGLNGLFAAWVVVWIAAAVYTAVCFRPYLTRPRDGRNAEPYGMWEQMLFGLKVALNGVMSYLEFRIDVFIILGLLGAAQLGIYSIGVGAGELMWQLNRPIAQAAFGRIGSASESEAAELTAKCMRHSLLLVFAGSVIFWFIGPPLITIVYGAAFSPAGNVIRMLLPGIIAYSTMPVIATFFQQQLGRPAIPLLFSTISTIICAIVTYATVPHWGIIGGAFATSLSYVIAFTAAVIWFMRRTGIGVRKLLIVDGEDLALYFRILHRA